MTCSTLHKCAGQHAKTQLCKCMPAPPTMHEGLPARPTRHECFARRQDSGGSTAYGARAAGGRVQRPQPHPGAQTSSTTEESSPPLPRPSSPPPHFGGSADERLGPVSAGSVAADPNLRRSARAQHLRHQSLESDSPNAYEPTRAAQGHPQWVALQFATMWTLPLAVQTTVAGRERAATELNSE